MRSGFWARYGKRLFDVMFSIVFLALFSWLFVIIAIFVRLRLGSPALFSQNRVGQFGREFRLYKFRSMTDARDQQGNLLPDSVRLTRFGDFLRRSSLDELPQIFNILRGDISLIGPRATLSEYLEDMESRYPKRFLVPQGLTSLAAIRGRNSLEWEEKLSLDVEYVDNFGFLQDMEILIKTIPVVLKRDGINMSGHVTAEKYKPKDGS